MQIKLFTIPAFGDETGEKELNKFLRTHRVLDVYLGMVFLQERRRYARIEKWFL